MIKTVAELNALNLGSFRDEESGSVALYHFLKNFYGNETLVTPELINTFFAEALQLPHWQENKEELFDDVLDLLKRFFARSGAVFHFESLWNLKLLQMILITSLENLYLIIQHYEQGQVKDGEKLRVMVDNQSFRTISVKRLANGDYIVRTFSQLVKVVGAYLSPLAAEQELFYDANLELKLNTFQKLKASPHSQVRFRGNQTNFEAQFISGFAFRQSQNVRVESLSQESRIFYPLKRLERFYIDRKSDPYYVELLAGLTKALEMTKSKTSATSISATSSAKKAFEAGQIAFDQIFPDDKVLYTKLKELAKFISVSPRDGLRRESSDFSASGQI